MSYYNELNELYMEKVAARSYGRNPDGSRRTADELISQLGDAYPIKNPTKDSFYWDGIKENRFKNVPQYYITGNGKYNFAYPDNNPTGRIEIGRHLQKSIKYPKKVENQHSHHINRLPGSRYTGDTKEDIKRLIKLNRRKDDGDVFSGRHPKPRIFGEEAKANVKKNKEAVEKSNNKHKMKFDGKLPYALLGAGLLTAGMAETNRLYNKIKDKREKEKQESKEKELASLKA